LGFWTTGLGFGFTIGRGVGFGFTIGLSFGFWTTGFGLGLGGVLILGLTGVTTGGTGFGSGL
jgi:hypothetical protein